MRGETQPKSALLHRDTCRPGKRLVVRAVMFLFVLSLVEGPLRKWGAPQLATSLILLRDPFAIMLYLYVFATGGFRRSNLFSIWFTFAFSISILGLVIFAIKGYPLSAWLLALRTYWLYLPLPFVIQRSFQAADVRRFVMFNLWLSIPYSLLVSVQYSSGASAFVNRGVGGDQDSAIAVADGLLRPFGLFTFTAPNVQYTLMMIAILLASLIAREYRVALINRIIFCLSVGTMSVLTGSRSIYFLGFVVVTLTAIGMLKARPTKSSVVRTLYILAFLIGAGFLFNFVFPDMMNAMRNRFNAAANFEGSIWNRVAGMFMEPFLAMLSAPFSGEGMASGTNAITKMLNLPMFIYGENEFLRIINELGPVLGLAFITLRICTSFWLFQISVKLGKKSDLGAIPLAAFSVTEIAIGGITSSPLNAFLPWLILGLVLALDELNKKMNDYPKL